MVSEGGSVVGAVQRDLDAIAERDAALATSGLALSALALAARIDDDENSATSVAACARALAETLATLRDLVPPKTEADGVDVLAAQRAKRIA